MMPEYPGAAITLRRPAQQVIEGEMSLRYETTAQAVRCELYPTGLRRHTTPLGVKISRHALALLAPHTDARQGDRVVMADGTTYEIDSATDGDIYLRCELREVK